MKDVERWPAFQPGNWTETYATLHMWTQIVGKISLALTPRTNHFWNIAMQVTSCGLATPLMPYHDRAFTIMFDFISHQLVIQSSDDERATVTLKPQTVADFYQSVMSTLRSMNINVRIWTMPVEVPNPIPFEKDVRHHS